MLYGELEDVANTLIAHGLLLVPAASRLEVICICTCKSLGIVNSLARLGNELRPNAFFFHLKLGNLKVILLRLICRTDFRAFS